MTNQQIEAWALRIVKCVSENRPVEDSCVELKREWPDPEKAARQIAAHLNAARGGDVLWLIGLDEENGVIGAERQEMATWFPKIQSRFEGVKPTVADLNVPLPFKEKEIVALLFKSDRAPYVVSTTGTDRLEVPWREGARTRSARRDEILSTVIEHGKDPEVEVMSLSVEANFQGNSSSWNISARFYLIPADDQRLVIPNHHCSATIHFQSWGKLEIGTGAFGGKPSDSVRISGTEAIVTGAGMLQLNLKGNAGASSLPDDEAIDVQITLGLVKPHVPITFSVLAPSIFMQGNPNARLWSFSFVR